MLFIPAETDMSLVPRGEVRYAADYGIERSFDASLQKD
jgi:hypothetical protein